MLEETHKAVEKTQMKNYERNIHSFPKEKLLTKKGDGEVKKQLEYRYVKGLSLKVTNISVVLVLARGLHMLYSLNEKKETCHRSALFSLMRIKVKINYH